MGTRITILHPLSGTSFFLLLDRGREKEALPESRQAFEIVWSIQTYFSSREHHEHPFTDEPITWSKLSPLYQAHGMYPSNMLAKDLARFRQSPGRVTISQRSYQTDALTLTSPIDISRKCIGSRRKRFFLFFVTQLNTRINVCKQ